MHETELDRERHRALVAEGLAVALTEAARRVSRYLQSELQRPEREQKTGKEGLEAALAVLRAQLGPLVTGAEATRCAEVLRRAKALARAVEDLEGWTAGGHDPGAGRPSSPWVSACDTRSPPIRFVASGTEPLGDAAVAVAVRARDVASVVAEDTQADHASTPLTGRPNSDMASIVQQRLSLSTLAP
jgi:hypothetical protein